MCCTKLWYDDFKYMIYVFFKYLGYFGLSKYQERGCLQILKFRDSKSTRIFCFFLEIFWNSILSPSITSMLHLIIWTLLNFYNDIESLMYWCLHMWSWHYLKHFIHFWWKLAKNMLKNEDSFPKDLKKKRKNLKKM